MKIYNQIDDLPVFKNAVVTIGSYDGVHLGHQQIIKRINHIAEETGGESVMVIFHPHPKIVLNPNLKDFYLINTLGENLKLFEQFGIDNVVIVSFTKTFSEQSPLEYVQDFLAAKIHAKNIVVGYNHRFGKDREGDIAFLNKYADRFGYGVEEIPKQLSDDIIISSTEIRNAIQTGDIKKAKSLLGYDFSIYGKVVKGEGLGQELDFPTANIKVEDPYKLIPADGIYAVRVRYEGQTYKGMLSIGFNPTFKGRGHTIEVNIFDFNQSIYGESISIEFVEFLRKEEKFDSPEKLKQQLLLDKERAMNIERG